MENKELHLGDRLKKLMEEKGYSPKLLAKHMGYKAAQSIYDSYERKEIGTKKVIAICEFMLRQMSRGHEVRQLKGFEDC